MRLVKVRKRVFKRAFMEFRIAVVVYDILEVQDEDNEHIVGTSLTEPATVLEFSRVFYVFPYTDEVTFDFEDLLKRVQKR